jgi:hypothetical protein
MSGALYITDGTIRINLLSGIDGFMLVSWNPSLAPAVDTWRQSTLSDGRKLAMSKWSNAIETFNFHVSRFTQDDVIYDTQELRRLLEQAKQYFIGGSDVPVWIEARGDCETNTRYAVICDYNTGNDSDPYHKPFDLDHPVMSPWSLVLERQHWLDVAPGLSTCVQLSATQAYYDIQDGIFVPIQSADDCEVDFAGAGSIILNHEHVTLGAGAAGSTLGSGFRFRNVTIPQGATIVSAIVEVESDGADANDTCNVTIYGDDTDDAAVFSTYADYVARADTTAHIHWDAIPHWFAGTHYQTPDISTVVQEIVSRAGWVSGNSMAILMDDNVSSVNAFRRPVAWDHAAVRYEPHLIVQWYDTTTRTFGRMATCNNEVYIANKHNIAQLTHIYVDDGGIFGANLVGAALPFQILPAVPAVSDAVYFGIATIAPDSGPFCSLVFDLSIIQTNVNTLTWEYYDSVAVAWHTLDVRDNTNANGAMTGLPFDTLGVNSVHWIQPAGAVHNWGTVAVNGITGYWVRARVGGIGAGPTAPTQANRDIYTIITPYVDTLAAQVPGDIQALTQMYLEGQSGAATPVIPSQTVIYAGLRSYDKGANFTAFLNLADEQNPTGITVTANGGTATFITDMMSPTGRVIDWTTGGSAANAWLAYITIPTTLVDDFTGQFRCFMRMQTISGTATDLIFRLKVCSSIYTNIVYQTNPVIPITGGSTNLEILDFGVITFPFRQNDNGDVMYSAALRIDGQALAAVHAHLVDVWIIPCDECFLKLRAVPPIGSVTVDQLARLVYGSGSPKRLNINSLLPRRMIKTDITNTSGTVFASWNSKSNSPIILQPNERQRWWFAQVDDQTYRVAGIYNALSAQAFKVSRYLSMRGAR